MRNAVLVQAEGAQRTRSALILSGNGCGPRTLVCRGPRAPAASWAAAQLRNRPWGLLASPAQPSTYSWRSRDTGPKSWTILTLPAGRPSQESGAACVLRAHYTHRVTGPHRLPHGARHPRGALSASSSRHGSHLRGWRAPSPRDVPLRPQDQRAARVSREGGDARPAAAPLGPGSGAQRQGLHHSAQTKVEGTVGRAPPHGGRVLAPKVPDMPSNPSWAPIRCRNSDTKPPSSLMRHWPQAWDGDSSASGKWGGLKGTGGHFSQSGSPARPHELSPKAPADRAKA